MELTKEKWNDIFHQKLIFQPDRSVPFTFRPKFRLHYSEIGLETRILVNGTARFVRTGPTGQRGPPPEVIPNIPVGPKDGPFHLTSARNFRKFWLNGKHPILSSESFLPYMECSLYQKYFLLNMSSLSQALGYFIQTR